MSRRCLDCDAERSAWRKGDRTTTGGRGLCGYCYDHHRHAGTLDLYARCLDCDKYFGPGSKGSRGLCGVCYRRNHFLGTLTDYPRTTYSADELLDDWVWLRIDGTTTRQAAERFGIKHESFLQALRRARKRGDERGNVTASNAQRRAA